MKPLEIHYTAGPNIADPLWLITHFVIKENGEVVGMQDKWTRRFTQFINSVMRLRDKYTSRKLQQVMRIL